MIKTLVYILSIISTFFLFQGGLLPGPAVGAAGIFNHLASFLAFSYAYYKTKDNFWLIMFASVPPMLMSDLYFFPLPRLPFFMGEDMLMWGIMSFLVISIGLSIYSKNSLIRYSNLLMVFIFPFSIPLYLSGNRIVGAFWLPVVCFSQSYYGIKMGKIVFASGPLVRWGAKQYATYYYFVLHGPNVELISGLTDRIGIFGRTLMAIGAL